MEENNIYETFGLRLARLRQERGLSQRELAEILSVTRQAVSGWKRGQTLPDLGTVDRICRALEVDWNRLCGGVEPPAPRRRGGSRRLPWAGALALALALVLGLTALIPPGFSRRAPAEEAPARAPWALRGEVLRSHQVTEWAPGPNGLQKKAAGDLAALLEALEAETDPGPVELTGALREGFDLFGEACCLRFLPACEAGRFADRNAVLTWLYRGLSRGGAISGEQAEAWLEAWFGPGCQWEHGSTEDFRLTEEGTYVPEGAWSGGCAYALESLERREAGGFLARLELRETDGAGEALPVRLLTVELTAREGQITFASVAWEEGRTEGAGREL